MIKRTLLFLTFALNALIVWAQERQAFPGTKYSIIPPEGFEPDADLGGFTNRATSSSLILVQEDGDAPIDSLVDKLSGDVRELNGITFLNKEVTNFNGSKASYLRFKHQTNGKTYLKFMLIFNDGQNMVSVVGSCLEKNKHTEPIIKKSLLSTVYNEELSTNANIAANFTVDLSYSPYKATKFSAGSVAYTQDGKIPTEKPAIIISHYNAVVAPEDQKTASISIFKPTPDADFFDIESVEPIRIDNMDGYEIIAKRKSDGEAMYQVTLFRDDGNTYLFSASANEDHEKNMTEFKRIARTFQRR